MEISLHLERLEGGRAFLKDEKGRLLVWPRDFLPNEACVGEDFFIFLKKKGEEKNSEDKEILAKRILNEILNQEESNIK